MEFFFLLSTTQLFDEKNKEDKKSSFCVKNN